MSLTELILVAIGLSMDAFAVSVCKGLSTVHLKRRHMILCGAYFGVFQALMPIIGYLLGAGFAAEIAAYDHWVCFLLLLFIGGNMVREGLEDNAPETDGGFSPKDLLPLAVATSIDALAVGISFAFLQVSILPASGLIGAATFLLSAGGVKIGSVFGGSCRRRAQTAGGIILILIGAKILIQHLIAG